MKLVNRVLVRVAGAAVIAAVAAVPTGASVANSATLTAGPHCHSPSIVNGRHVNGRVAANHVGQFIAHLRQTGASHKAITEALASQLCVVLQGPGDTYTLTSSSSTNMSITEDIGHDTQAHLWYSIGSWSWLNDNYQYDQSNCLNCAKNIGPPDGIATAFNHGMFLKGDSLTWWGNGYAYGTSTSNARTTASQYGVGYEHQDKWYEGFYGEDDNMSYGELVIDFVSQSSCVSGFQAFTEYSHTWSSTHITGMSIGPWSAGMSWDSTTSHWQRTQYNTTGYTVCGS